MICMKKCPSWWTQEWWTAAAVINNTSTLHCSSRLGTILHPWYNQTTRRGRRRGTLKREVQLMLNCFAVLCPRWWNKFHIRMAESLHHLPSQTEYTPAETAPWPINEMNITLFSVSYCSKRCTWSCWIASTWLTALIVRKLCINAKWMFHFHAQLKEYLWIIM